MGVSPSFNLFLLEGTSQDCCINGMAYGNGFATNVAYISEFNGGGGATFQQARPCLHKHDLSRYSTLMCMASWQFCRRNKRRSSATSAAEDIPAGRQECCIHTHSKQAQLSRELTQHLLQPAFSTPDAFLTSLATNAALAPVLARTIISPHIYGPNVTGKRHMSAWLLMLSSSRCSCTGHAWRTADCLLQSCTMHRQPERLCLQAGRHQPTSMMG